MIHGTSVRQPQKSTILGHPVTSGTKRAGDSTLSPESFHPINDFNRTRPHFIGLLYVQCTVLHRTILYTYSTSTDSFTVSTDGHVQVTEVHYCRQRSLFKQPVRVFIAHPLHVHTQNRTHQHCDDGRSPARVRACIQ